MEEVRKNARIENSFINVLYNKIIQEQKAFMSQNMKSTNSLSAKTNIQPSFIPSISSSLNQSHISTNTLNKT